MSSHDVPSSAPPPNITRLEFCGYRATDEWGARLSCVTVAEYRLAIAPGAPPGVGGSSAAVSCARHLPAYLRDGWVLEIE